MKSTSCKYSTGDIIGVYIDISAGNAFYTKNGEVMSKYGTIKNRLPHHPSHCQKFLSDTGFRGINGRVSPLLGLGSGAIIEANLGRDLNTNSFKYPSGPDKVRSCSFVEAKTDALLRMESPEPTRDASHQFMG